MIEIKEQNIRISGTRRYVKINTPKFLSNISEKKINRMNALASIIAETIDKDGNPIQLDGDVVYLGKDRPPSAELLKNQFDLMNDIEEIDWIGYDNNIYILNKNCIAIALADIQNKVKTIWGIL